MIEIKVSDEHVYKVYVKFHKTGELRGTTAVIESKDNRLFSGFAKFHPDDKWSEKAGARIAFNRAVKAMLQEMMYVREKVYTRNCYALFRALLWREFVDKVLNQL